jgi:hypothetical protein
VEDPRVSILKKRLRRTKKKDGIMRDWKYIGFKRKVKRKGCEGQCG